MGEAPGVDGGIVFAFDAGVRTGDFVDVRLDGNTAFDFHGTRVHARELAGAVSA
jgi:hypothetical protein